MDDSDQDFVDLCSKLLKRVRKKPGEPSQPRRAEQQQQQQPSSQSSDGDKRKRNKKRDDDYGSKGVGAQPVGTGAGAEQHGVLGGTGSDSGDAGSSGVPRAERAKDKVLQRMQQFKRASPQRMVHKDKSQTTSHEIPSTSPPPPLEQRQDTPQSLSSGLHPEPQDSDGALALRLQQELDRETAGVQTVDLEDGGLFFCQICQRDLSHMTPEGRTQHLNRCLDESEGSAPPPLPPPPPSSSGVPDCPICGKKFKTQKSRSTHLKRCSSDMGVPPAVLLQALQRQAEDTQNVPSANTLTETGGTKRKGPAGPGLPARKKPRKKTEPLDEDTMVALALSSSLLEQERGSERALQTETAASHISMDPVLKWRPDRGKGRGRRKKGAVPRPPPLLLVQDAAAALVRLQERVSALLLRSRAPSPPTPTLSPSTLPGRCGAAPLWQKSTLLDGGSTCVSDFYTPELRGFITPWDPAAAESASSSTFNKSAVQPVSEGTPVTETRASILPSSSQTAASSPAPSTPGTGQLSVGSQTLRDLMELAEDGMTLTQRGNTASNPDGEKSTTMTTNLHLSGFVPEASEEQADLCASGFLPEMTHTRLDETHRRARGATDQPQPDKDRGGHRSVALSRLASDLGSMVNNPQLSDVQLQVDSGEVYFAHSFMVYARCPLLAEMVHESGIGVQEEGMPAAQRVLISDVPEQAVFSLLQYLYTAKCSIPASLRPHVLELASRFDLQELQQLCKVCQENAATHGEEDDYMNQEENASNQTDQAFVELLRSMWNEEDEDNGGTDTDEGSGEERGSEEDRQADDLVAGDREIGEEKVNEEELEEIYEFAATQRKKEEEEDSVKEEEEEEVKVDEEEDGEEVFAQLAEPEPISAEPNPLPQPDMSLDRSYNRLFSDSWGVYEEGNPSSRPTTSGQPRTRTLQFQTPLSSHKLSSELSGRTLLQSSASVVSDLSPSPPPSASNLPFPGQSPGQEGDRGTDAADQVVSKEGNTLRRESRGPRTVFLSADSPEKKKEPELIVLSDSSEDMEVVLSSRSPSPHSPCANQNPQSYTQIKSPPEIPNESTRENKKSSSLESSPECAGPADCSAEVSWLIPSTPLQHRRSSTTTTTSSTQTRSSMCRTQLFPKVDTSSPSAFSSPAHGSPTEGSVPWIKQEEMLPCSSSFNLNLSPKRSSSSDVSKVKEVFAVPSSQSKRLSLTSSKQDTPLHPQLQPYSSTPLHTELHQPPVPLTTSPLARQRPPSRGRDSVASDGLEKTELGSFHLSPLSDPSDPPSSSSHRRLQSSERHSDSSPQSRRSNESRSRDELSRGTRDDEGERELQFENKETCEEGELEEAGVADVAESSFQQSFMAMDEPPIAFNDSWGLDVCAEANPGCFSLRLEDSAGSSQHENSSGRREPARSSSSTDQSVRSSKSRSSATVPSPSKAHSTHPSTSVQAHPGPPFTPSPPDPTIQTSPGINNSLLDPKIWDSWEEEEEGEALPLSQRVNTCAQLKTPASSRNKRRRTLVPITPMPHYSDLDTPELKNKLNRFGVRPLPKRQMILKLKEIHQYTHQLVSSDEEEEKVVPSVGRTAQVKPPPSSSVSAGNRLLSCTQTVRFKEPRAPADAPPLRHNEEEEEEEEEEEAELLSASQGSNTSSTAASEESERSNPVLCLSSDANSDSDGGVSSSQAATRLQDRLQAVRSFILSDSELYTQILQYQPLVLSQLQGRLKAAGIRLGTAKLVDYLDSQCITFTTAKPGQSAPGHRRVKRTGRGAKAAGGSGASRNRGVPAVF